MKKKMKKTRHSEGFIGGLLDLPYLECGHHGQYQVGRGARGAEVYNEGGKFQIKTVFIEILMII
jgi:hypothetical protein